MLINRVRDIYYRVPESIQRAVLVRRRQPIWMKHGIIFIHVPKVAGTAINETLYGRFMGHVHATDIRRWGSRQLNHIPMFALTRNPWDRLVSAYRFVKRGGGSGGPNAGRVRWHYLYQGPKFDSFDRFVKEWLQDSDLSKLDPAFQLQTRYVCDASGKVIVDHLGRVENLDATCAFLRNRFPDLPPFARSNVSGKSVDYRTFYNAELVELVRSIYEPDVRLLDYSFE